LFEVGSLMPLGNSPIPTSIAEDKHSETFKRTIKLQSIILLFRKSVWKRFGYAFPFVCAVQNQVNSLIFAFVLVVILKPQMTIIIPKQLFVNKIRHILWYLKTIKMWTPLKSCGLKKNYNISTKSKQNYYNMTHSCAELIKNMKITIRYLIF